MAIVSIKEIGDRGSEIDEAALVTRSRSFRVVIDSQTTDDVQVIDEFSETKGIYRYSPWIGSGGSVDLTCRAVSLSATHEFDNWTWIIKVQYSTLRAGDGGGFSPRSQRERAEMARQNARTGEQPNSDPTLRPPVYTWGSQEYQEALREALRPNGLFEPVVNSAGMPYVPPPMRTLSIRTLSVERNDLQYDPVDSWRYENKVNSTAFVVHEPGGFIHTFPPLTVLCKHYVGNNEFESGVSFAKVSILLWMRLDGWKVKILDAGRHERKNGVLVPIIGRFGDFVSDPVPLDGAGLQLPLPLPPRLSLFQVPLLLLLSEWLCSLKMPLSVI